MGPQKTKQTQGSSQNLWFLESPLSWAFQPDWRILMFVLYYPYETIPYYTRLDYTTLYFTKLYHTIPYSTLLYSTLLYSTLLYSTPLHSIDTIIPHHDPAFPNYLLRDPIYQLIETIRPSIEVHWGSLYFTKLYHTLLYSTLLYSILQYHSMLQGSLHSSVSPGTRGSPPGHPS